MLFSLSLVVYGRMGPELDKHMDKRRCIYRIPTLQIAAVEYKINVISRKSVSSIVTVSSLNCFP